MDNLQRDRETIQRVRGRVREREEEREREREREMGGGGWREGGRGGGGGNYNCRFAYGARCNEHVTSIIRTPLSKAPML